MKLTASIYEVPLLHSARSAHTPHSEAALTRRSAHSKTMMVLEQRRVSNTILATAKAYFKESGRALQKKVENLLSPGRPRRGAKVRIVRSSLDRRLFSQECATRTLASRQDEALFLELPPPLPRNVFSPEPSATRKPASLKRTIELALESQGLPG